METKSSLLSSPRGNQRPLIDRTNGQLCSTGLLQQKAERTPVRPKPSWSEASKRRKASLDHFFATGNYSSDSDEEVTVLPAVSRPTPSSTSKAAVICQSLKRQSLFSDVEITDEELPDLVPEPRTLLRTALPPGQQRISNPTSTNVGVGAIHLHLCATKDIKRSQPKLYAGNTCEELLDLEPAPGLYLIRKMKEKPEETADCTITQKEFVGALPTTPKQKLHNYTELNFRTITENLSSVEASSADIANSTPAKLVPFSPFFGSEEIVRASCDSPMSLHNYTDLNFRTITENRSSIEASSADIADTKETLPCCNPQTKECGITTPPKLAPLSPFFGSEEIVRENCDSPMSSQKTMPDDELHRETKFIPKQDSKMDVWDNAQNFIQPDWENISRASPPVPRNTSMPRLRKRLFASLTSEDSEVGTQVKAEPCPSTIGSEEITNTSTPMTSPGNVKSEVCAVPLPGIECNGCLHHSDIHNYCKQEKWQSYAYDSDDDNKPTFARCDLHVEQEKLFGAWYRRFVKHRRMASMAWRNCLDCQSLHEVYKSPGLAPKPENLHCFLFTSDIKPQSTGSEEVIDVIDSDDDTIVIELSSGDEGSNAPLLRRPSIIDATLKRRTSCDPNEVISISDDDTVDLDLSHNNEEVLLINDITKASTTPKKQLVAPMQMKCIPMTPETLSPSKASAKQEAFEFLRSPKEGMKSSCQKTRMSRRAGRAIVDGKVTLSKNGLITTYFQASPKSEVASALDSPSCPKRPRPLGAEDPIPRRKLFQQQVEARDSTWDSGEEFEAPQISIKKLQSPFGVAVFGDLNQRIEQGDVMDSCLDEDGGVDFEATREDADQRHPSICSGPLVSELISMIEQLIYNSVEAKGPHLPLGLQIIYDCCTATVKTSYGLVAQLLTIWQNAENSGEAQLCHDVLSNLQRRHHVLHEQNLWHRLQEIATVMETSEDLVQLQANTLLMEFLTQTIEDDLEQVLASQRSGMAGATSMRQSLVYKWLDPITESARIRAAQQWMASALIRNHRSDVAGRLSLFLSSLSRLLEMALKVSKSSSQKRKLCSKSMASNFCSIYAQLPLWVCRRDLIDLVQPASLQSFFLSTLLEERGNRSYITEDCARTYLARSLSTEKIMRYFFQMGPLSFDNGDVVHQRDLTLQNEESYEELLYLLFHLLRSYLESTEECISSREMSKFREIEKAFQSLESRCYLACPIMQENILFQQTSVKFQLLFV